MTESTYVDNPTTIGGLGSGNINNACESTTSWRTETLTPTINKNKGRNKYGGKSSNGVNCISSTVPLVAKSFEGMTPAIIIVLLLPGEKVTLAKPINGFRNDFLTYTAANEENGADNVPLFRDGEDPIEIFEKKSFQY